MKKYLIAATLLVAFVGQANAWDNRRHNPHPQQYQHRHHHHNVAPWVAGGLALGVLGAMIYSQQPACWDELVGYDRYGREVWQRICR